MSNYIVNELQIKPDFSSVKPESGLNVPQINPPQMGQSNEQFLSTAPEKLYDTNYFVDKTPTGDERKNSLRRGKDPVYWVTPSVNAEIMKYRKRIDPFYSTRIRVCNLNKETETAISSLREIVTGLSETIDVRSLKDNYLDLADKDNLAYAAYFRSLGIETEIVSNDDLLNDTNVLMELNHEAIAEDVKSNLGAILEITNYLKKEPIIA
ncbi:MAG: hypothetical protein KJ697_00945 [Nanoarchaeota archaeon]|nr:hypothetical protein [Nanoarchaeota archaeon]